MTSTLEGEVAKRIMALCQSLDNNGEKPLSLDTSLTYALGFDSLKLMQFFAGVEELYPGVALEDWFIEHSTDGRDTLRSAVSHLAQFLAPRATKG